MTALVSSPKLRVATAADAEAIAAIYAPLVRSTAISFETEPPSAADMRARIETTLQGLPWLVSLDDAGGVSGYAYAGRHRERAAYQWSVETTVYVGEGSRGKGVGRALYSALFEELVRLGYYQAFAGITLPNAASVALHEGLGFAPIGIYRQVGHKLGRWHDVGWWQRPLQEPVAAPLPPRRFAGALAR